ncbi:MAG: site-2 protease family protein, partial [bacterium]
LYLAVFNLLPIPVTDGGRVVFLLIEKIRGRAINQKIEEKIEGVFFIVLLVLMALVTIKDIVKLF